MMDECVENNRGKEFSAPGKADCENHQDGSEVKPSDKVSSPSDAIMSPCTQRLFGKSRLKNAHGIHPGALLKEKQRNAVASADQDRLSK
ncbi:unnamed protein product [Enterobius vermicularis]|uniref:Protein phosphatase inhibitor n=1 Tax=Enterobius vermicularis TaxID=51028 RepID=A0A0N4VEY6_ENTVE|nr:unnamed protein product [Enterobius vermicularis]